MTISIETGVRRALICTAAAAGLMAAGTASAADAAPRVDLTQPHLQQYPESAQANGEEGTVMVAAYVRPDGRPSKIQVQQSSGYSDLDNAAVASVFNWRFIPAMHNGDTVSDWAAVKIVYQLPRPPLPQN